MSTAATVSTPATRLLLAAGLPAGAGLLYLALLPAQPQSLAYHEFADARTLLGISNFLNVATNVPFLLVGALGIVFLLADSRSRHAFQHPRERWPYLLFFAGVALTSAGSAFYHLAPDNPRLAFDRLPMTLDFMPLLAATIVDRVDPRGGYIYAVFALYALAKVAEIADACLFELGAVLSGHSLKHLLAALGALLVLRMLVLRSEQTPEHRS